MVDMIKRQQSENMLFKNYNARRASESSVEKFDDSVPPRVTVVKDEADLPHTSKTPMLKRTGRL